MTGTSFPTVAGRGARKPTEGCGLAIRIPSFFSTVCSPQSVSAAPQPLFSACLFCRAPLGANETFETFPVGRRLAYDAAKGRLWVVCPQCARWNLTPLEERWEAIDDAERRIDSARIRASTGEVTLARLPEGTELVRIGRPVQRELATWRYGDQFGRRRRRNLVVGGTVAAVTGVVLVGGAAAAGVGAAVAGSVTHWLQHAVKFGLPWATVARLRAPDGSLLAIRPSHIRGTRFGATRDGEIEVRLPDPRPYTFDSLRPSIRFTGPDAAQALRSLMPAANRLGGTKDDLDVALARLASARSPRELIEGLARSRTNLTPTDGDLTGFAKFRGAGEKAGLFAIPPGIALAIEMALNEDRERLAMEGDLEDLVAAWQEAEEIARIADDLLLPEEVTTGMARLKRAMGKLVGP